MNETKLSEAESMVVTGSEKFRDAPVREYFLQGSIFDNARDLLLHRLRGFCDSITDLGYVQFHEHEMVFAVKLSMGQTVQLRARRSVDHAEAPWQLRYIGLPEANDLLPTMVRTAINVPTTDNLREFLMEMGFVMDYEYILKGFMLRKGIMKVFVYKVFKLLQAGHYEANTLEPLTGSHVVEASIIAPLGHDKLAVELKGFAEKLKPLVSLDKIDFRHIHQRYPQH